MPPGKVKPKDDTWTTNELNDALKKTRGDLERKRRSRNADVDRERRRSDDGNEDESHRKHKQGSTRSHKDEDDGSKGKSRSNRDVSPEPVVELTEEDRERLRQERRERRGGKAEKKEERPPHKERKPVDSDEDMKLRRLRDDEERRQRREAHDEGRVKGDKSQNKDKEEREQRREERDKERRHGKADREQRRERGGGDHKFDELDRERRREGVRERHPVKDDTERRSKTDEKERRHEKDEREQLRDRDDTERRSEKDGKERRHERDQRERRHDREEHREKENKDQKRHRSRKESQHREDNDDYEQKRQETKEKREKYDRPDEERAKKDDRQRDRDRRDRDRPQLEEDNVRHGDDKNRDREREERRHRREKDRDERHKDRKERYKDPQDWNNEQGDYQRKRDSEKDKHRKKEQEEEEEQRKRREARKQTEKEEQIVQAKTDDNPNEYEDDFEDYEEDFEDDTDGKEMDEIMQALAEENARLTAASKGFAQSNPVEHNGSENGDDGHDHSWDRMPEKPRPKAFINFVSAKQRVMNRSVASTARRRADDLRNMIELDTVYYDMLDLPPVKEYELYIRSFGRSNTKQAYVQTNEDAVERDVQTEKVDDLEKWTQHPADDVAACGGEGLVVKETTWHARANADTESSSVAHLLDQAAQVVSILLEEEKGVGEQSNTREDRSSLSISEGVTQLASLPFFSGRHVEHACFCPLQPQMFLTVYSRPKEVSGGNPIDNYGLICVWSTRESAYPQKILTSVSQPTCACFSPVRTALVMAGMVDGSVCVWDLREPPHLHRTVFLRDQDFCIRFPTYNTAGVNEKENHHSSVVAITAVHPTVIRKDVEESSSENSLGLSFQLASVEENGVVNLWVVTEIQSPDMAGSEMDLGLAPGGRIKLVHSSGITLENPKNTHAGNPRAVDVKLNPSDLNHFFVATDLGQVIHGVRFGSRVYPRVYQPVIDFMCSVTCIDFSPFGEPYFLTGCEDGSVHLYHTSSEHPLTSWPMFTGGHPIVSLQWSQSRPAVFFVLAASSSLYVFDLVESGLSPVRTDKVSSDRVKTMAVANDPVSVSLGKSQPAYLLLCLENGMTELHKVCEVLRQPQPLEKDFLARYLERF